MGAAGESLCILFTDIEGSTRLLRELGDDYADLLDEHHRLIRAALTTHRGREVDTQGDSFFALFPDACDAVACALKAQLGLLATQGPGRPVRVRMGLHLGTVHSASSGYLGMAIHEGARVAASANGGQVVLTDAVRVAVGDRLPAGASLIDLGFHKLKDFPEPQRIYQLGHTGLPTALTPLRGTRPVGRAPEPGASFVQALEQRSEPSSAAFPSLLDMFRQGPFVGRDRDLVALGSACASPEPGWRLTTVAGEAGMGKTRLTAELAFGLHQRGATVLYGRCAEDAVIPFQAMVEALRSYLAAAPAGAVPDDLAVGELGRLIPELRRLVPELGAPSGEPVGADGADLARYRLFEAFRAIFDHAATSHPVLVVLEDLHWADRPTLALLRHLLRGGDRSPVLFLGTYRPADVRAGHPLASALADVTAAGRLTRVELAGLDETAVAALAQQIGGVDTSLEASTLLEKTGGNPFFLREVLYQGPASADALLPGGVVQVVLERFAALTDATRRVLTVAAVAGAEFGIEVVENVVDIDGDVVEELDVAIASGIVAEVPDALGRFTFVHALLRDAVYGQLSSLNRARLHLRVATALEQHGGGTRGRRAGEIAAHLFAAGTQAEPRRVTEWAARAGEQAASDLAHEDACRYFEQAVAAAETLDDDATVRLQIQLGEVRWLSGDYLGANAVYRQAAETAVRLDDPAVLADAALGYGGRLVGFTAGLEDPQLIVWLRAALAVLPTEELARRALLTARLAEAVTELEAPEVRIGLGREAIDLARRGGDPRALAMVLLRAQWNTWSPDNAAERLSMGTEARSLAESVGDYAIARDARAWTITAMLELGELASISDEMQAVSSAATELRHPYAMWVARFFDCTLAHLEGRLDDAEAAATDALAIGQTAQNLAASQLFGLQLAGIRRDQGRMAELEPVFEALLAQLPDNRRGWLMALALLHAEAGQHERAMEELDELFADGLRGFLQSPAYTSALGIVAQACVEAGATDHSAVVYELLLPERDRFSVGVAGASFLGSFRRPLGGLAAVLGRFDEAAEHFEIALTEHVRTGAVVWLAHTQQEYARALVQAGNAAHRERARELLAAARETAEQCGLALVRQRCEATEALLAAV